jgi:hypothetical protein
MKKIGIALACIAVATVAVAQQLTTRPYENWPVYKQLYPRYHKVLPEGYFHFQPVSDDLAKLRFSGKEFVICKESFKDPNNPGANAISFGLRLWDRYTINEAVDYLKRAHGGDTPCGYYTNGYYYPTHVSVRGADSTGRQIFLLRLRDSFTGGVFYMGIPYNW